MAKKVRGIRLLIDEGYKKHKCINELGIELDEIKRKIRSHAKATGNKHQKGYLSKVVVQDWSSSRIIPADAYTALDESILDFLTVVDVVRGRLKNYLSDEEIDSITKTKKRSFYAVCFFDINEDLV